MCPSARYPNRVGRVDILQRKVSVRQGAGQDGTSGQVLAESTPKKCPPVQSFGLQSRTDILILLN
jgi:hypothetical protein